MKKFLLLIILFSSILTAEGTALVLKSYGTDKYIDTKDIENYASKFILENQDEKDNNFVIVLINSEDESTIKQNNTHKFRWIMLELDTNLSSGNYWVEHTGFAFTEHTFNTLQSLDTFSLLGRKFFSFHYNKTRDSKRYFLKIVNSQSHVIPMSSLYTSQTFSKWAKEYGLKMLLSFFLFGLIFMAALYNGALYFYNREKSFLYYMLMLFSMLAVLVYQTDLIQTYVKGNIENEEIAIFSYFLIVEVAILFVLLFIRSFLETEKYLVFHDKVLTYFILIAWVDLFLFFVPIILILHLYALLLLYAVWLAWLRLRQGYKPALFFIFGWIALMLGIVASDFVDNKDLYVDPILMGSTIEALFLALAISYKTRTIRIEKEQQKELLIHQSKLASMGDMLGNIAHQWRQPLSRLGYILMNIESKDKAQHHTQKLEEASSQLEFMSQTIDDFRDFYKPDKEKESFGLVEETKKVLALLDFKEINVTLYGEEVTIFNHKNAYKQVLLNLLTNAKDALKERAVPSPKIKITIEQNAVSISDNAGGIETENIQRIFEPYFSTKAKGLGIGLYMSKVIVEKNMGGKLMVNNTQNGALFNIVF